MNNRVDIKQTISRIVRAPFFVGSLAISMIMAFFIFATVSVGSWCEDALHLLGYKSRPRWLPAVLGVVGYTGLGIAGPAYLGDLLIGWPGAILGPLLVLGAIALLGRW